MVKLRPDAVECRTMQSFVFSSASEAAASAAADAAAALNVPIGAQLSIAAVAAAKIAIDLAISQDDAADAAASCTENHSIHGARCGHAGASSRHHSHYHWVFGSIACW